MFPYLFVVSAVLFVAAMPYMAQAHEQECRRFTEEIRVGGDLVDSYGTLCRQPDGSWREVASRNDDDEKGGYFIRPDDGRYYAPNTHTHYFDDDYNTRVIIGDSRQPYVVIEPFYDHGYHYDRHWSPAKRAFHQYHHGPGWEKHWKMHERTLNGK